MEYGKTKWWHIVKVDGTRVFDLAKRIHKVQLENRKAFDILCDIANCNQSIVYCDPPYCTSDISPYESVMNEA